jgi:glycine/D-amino acid oxidase-like deaminating enzyme
MVDAAVLIVGCGPTGLIAAHELLRRGISCRLVANLCARRTAAMARVRWFWCVPTFTWVTSVAWPSRRTVGPHATALVGLAAGDRKGPIGSDIVGSMASDFTSAASFVKMERL